MFLDNELLELCKSYDCSIPDNIQKLNVELCKKCENYYKSQIVPGMLKKDVKIVMDRTFNIWDSFTRMAIKEGGNMQLLGELFQTYTFKKQLLSNPQMNEIYNSL